MRISRQRAVLLTILGVMVGTAASAQISEKEQKRKALNDEFDKLKLRQETQFVVDCSAEFLQIEVSPSHIFRIKIDKKEKGGGE